MKPGKIIILDDRETLVIYNNIVFTPYLGHYALEEDYKPYKLVDLETGRIMFQYKTLCELENDLIRV